ncbi:hypothetical protein LEP1GSC085_2377 [Leptospira interrogans str. L0996]|nr:hypothetical protein LEP1GSC085_2377 [Leptospira interrogans str. L0996]
MKFISLNCNGIRSSLEKGLADYIRNQTGSVSRNKGTPDRNRRSVLTKKAI